MAIGFPPKYIRELSLKNISSEHFLSVALIAAKKRRWNIDQINENGLIAFTKHFGESSNEEISINIEGNKVILISKSVKNILFDLGRNEANILDFIDACNWVENTFSEEEIINKNKGAESRMAYYSNIYSPNHIPSSERKINLILSLILLTYGTFGVINDDLYIPGKRSPGFHFHGEPMWILYGAFICAIVNMLGVIIDHYDQRNNEMNYKVFARVTQIAGWILFILALTLDMFLFHKGTRY